MKSNSISRPMMACRIVSRDRLRRCSHEVLPCVAVRGDFWNAAVPKSVLLKVAFGSRAEDSAAAGHRSFTPTYGRSSAPLAPQPSAKSGLLHPPPSLVDPQGPRSLCKIAICGTRESAFDSTVDVTKHSPLWTISRGRVSASSRPSQCHERLFPSRSCRPGPLHRSRVRARSSAVAARLRKVGHSRCDPSFERRDEGGLCVAVRSAHPTNSPRTAGSHRVPTARCSGGTPSRPRGSGRRRWLLVRLGFTCLNPGRSGAAPCREEKL
jgi:hypothetical protein